jgi:hypothetical protein
MVHEVNRQASHRYTEVRIEREELLEKAIIREGGKAVMELKKLGRFVRGGVPIVSSFQNQHTVVMLGVITYRGVSVSSVRATRTIHSSQPPSPLMLRGAYRG